MVHQDRLDLAFGALADPTRRGILAILAGRERTIAAKGESIRRTASYIHGVG